MAKRARRPRNRVANQPEDAGGAALELVISPDPAQPEQDVREHRVPRGCRVVVELLLPRDQLLAVGRREEETASFLVGKELDGEPGEPVRLLEPAEDAGSDVQLVEPVGHVRVVLEVARVPGAASPPAAVEATVL